MKTVNCEHFEPKTDCWAYENGGCKILTDTYCKKSSKCGHYKTARQHEEGLKKAKRRLAVLGYSLKAQKNNRVSGN